MKQNPSMLLLHPTNLLEHRFNKTQIQQERFEKRQDAAYPSDVTGSDRALALVLARRVR